MIYAMYGTGYCRDMKKGIVMIPPTTDSALVFPYDQDAKRFDKNFYASALTDGRLSTERVETFLGEVEDIYKQKFNKLRILKCYLTASLILGFGLFMILTSIVISDFDDEYVEDDYSQIKQKGNLRSGKKVDSDYYEETEDLSLVFLGWAFFVFGTLAWTIILSIYSRITQKKARKAVQMKIDHENQFFANYGLRWNLPLAFPHWIELWKDYRGQNYNHFTDQTNFNLTYSNQAQNQIQNPRLHQASYPSLNQTIDPSGYLNLQQRTAPKAFLNHQVSGQDSGNYTPPYPIIFSNNN